MQEVINGARMKVWRQQPDDFFAEDFFDVAFFTVAFFFAEVDREDFALALFEDFDDFEDRAFELLALTVFADAQRTRLRLLRAVRPLTALVQRTGLGLVHPAWSSARKEAGIARTGVGPSITARTAASERSERTSAMTFAGRCAFAACTRFVSRTTNISRSGSIQIDVPVKPVCPYARSVRYLPEP